MGEGEVSLEAVAGSQWHSHLRGCCWQPGGFWKVKQERSLNLHNGYAKWTFYLIYHLIGSCFLPRCLTYIWFSSPPDHSAQISCDLYRTPFNFACFPSLFLSSCPPTPTPLPVHHSPSKSRHDSEGVARSHCNGAQELRRSHRRGHLSGSASPWVLQEAR